MKTRIVIKRFVDDPLLSFEARYDRLLAHHTEETQFLIRRIEELEGESVAHRTGICNSSECMTELPDVALHDILNDVYAGVLEELGAHEGKQLGNTHHMAQRIVGSVRDHLMKRGMV